MKFLRENFEKIAVIIFVLAAFLIRFVNIDKTPIGFNADEASFGYDAYSILKTGKDQWGNFFPVVLKSFGDYKSPLYSYLDIPFIGTLGLTKFATRLPSVVIGTLAVAAVYLLSKEILRRLKVKKAGFFATATAILLAINPWSVMMSRGAFEANLITFFLPLGLYFFLVGLRNPKNFIFSAILLGLSMFTYHSAKVITPLVTVELILVFWKDLRKINFKKILPGLAILLIFFAGLAYTFAIGGASRAVERSITNGALEVGASQKINIISNGGNPFWAKVFHNKYTVIADRFTTNYFQYFSSKFLFTNGAGEASYGMIPGIGVIYIFDGILMIGLIPLLFKKEFRLTIFLIFVWLIITPIPAALATGVGYAGNRGEGMIPVVQILEGLGFLGWFILLNRWNKYLFYAFTLLLFVLSIFSVKGFITNYFGNTSESVAKGMLYGDLETMEWLWANSKGKDIVVSRGLSEPQIFVGFASTWDPVNYQKETRLWNFDKLGYVWLDQGPDYSLGNYTIKSIDWKTEILDENTILVGRSEELPNEIKPDKIIYYPDGSPDISIVVR